MSETTIGDVEIAGYLPGAIGRVTELHGAYYGGEWNFAASFEATVAAGLAEFLLRFDPARDGFWTASLEGRVEGGVALDGLNAQEGDAWLRWFILSGKVRGLGVGNRLMREVVGFCRARRYRRVSLSTFDGLKAARHLYEKFGFRLAEPAANAKWDLPVAEQRYVLELEA